MKKSGMFLLLLCFCKISLAQSRPKDKSDVAERAKIAIIKSTLEFIAGKGDSVKCNDCGTYQKLIGFSAQQNIKGGEVFVNSWKAVHIDISADNFENSLTDVKTDIFNRVMGIEPKDADKQERSDWPTYVSYKETLDAIVIEALKEAKNEAAGVVVTPVTDSTQHDTTAAGATESIFGNNSGNSILPGSPFAHSVAIALLFCLCGGLLWIIKNLRKQLSTADADVLRWKAGKERLDHENHQLKSDLKESRQQVERLNIDNGLLEAAMKKQMESSGKEAVPAEITSMQHTRAAVKGPDVVKKYARYADQGDGFSMNELLDEEDSETIFELAVTSANNGSFRIAGNPAAQKYALSNSAYFLSKTCEYDEFPSLNSTIHTTEPGVLKLLGNKWQIVQPIKIRFS